MKNTLNYIWSLWSKSDRIIAVVSTICIVLLVCIFCTSCNAQPNLNDIPDMEYYNPNQDEDILDNHIPIYADGVIDFIYCTQDYEFIIEYLDDDYFDVDNLPQTVNCVGNDSVVCIYCSEEYFHEYLNWYCSIGGDTIAARNTEEFHASNPIFYIKEVFIEDDDYDTCGFWYYKLEKK